MRRTAVWIAVALVLLVLRVRFLLTRFAFTCRWCYDNAILRCHSRQRRLHQSQ